jgi:hypothetical protein
VHEDKTAYESLGRRGTVITTQGPIFHDQQPRDTPTLNDPESDNGFIRLSSDEETSPSLIRKETAISSSPSISSSLIGRDDRTPPPRTAKQRKAAYNESNPTRLTQQPDRTTHGSEDDIDIDEIATRERESEREREGEREREHRSQTGSRNRSTNISIDSVITDEEEDSVASRTRRNKRRRKHNKTRRRILTDQQQDGDDDENNSYVY